MRAKKKKGPCRTMGCWKDAEVAGWCIACYHATRRLLFLSPRELADYIRTRERFLARASFAVKRVRRCA